MLFSADQVDFSRARPVISVAQKYIVLVPRLADADPLVYPPGCERAGRPITDWQGHPIGEKGIIFFNEVDRCHQAVAADGRSVIVINEVTDEQARAIEDFVGGLGQAIDRLSKRSLERLLAFVKTELGLLDIYNSSDAFVRSKMKPMEGATGFVGARPWGWMRRVDGEICHAVFVKGPAQFAGPAATAQQIPPQGAFIVRQGRGYRMVDLAVMLRTYMNPDCRPLDLGDFLT
jgi:hypothetical protein